MNAFLLTTALALGQPPDATATPSTALDGVWTVIAMEVDGRPATVTDKSSTLAIRNSTLTLPGAAAMHGTLRLDLGARGTMRVIPAAVGTGNRRDPLANNTSPTPAASGPTNAPTGTSGTGIPGAATGVYVRTADYLIMTIGDPSAATATGTGTGPTGGVPATSPPDATANPPTTGTVATVGQPPVTIVLRRSMGNDAAPSTASAPPAADSATTAPATQEAPRRASEIIGQNVTASDGTTVGRVSDVAYGADGTGYALTTSTTGATTTTTPIPLNAMNFGANGQLSSLGMTPAQFGALPTLANGNLNMLTNPNFVNRLRNGFGLPIRNTTTSSTTSTTTIGNGTITSPNTGLPVNPTGPGTGRNANPGANTNPNTNNPNTNQPGTNQNPNTTNPNTNPNTNQPGTNPNTNNNQPGTNPNNNNPNNNQPKSGVLPKGTPPKGSVPPKVPGKG